MTQSTISYSFQTTELWNVTTEISNVTARNVTTEIGNVTTEIWNVTTKIWNVTNDALNTGNMNIVGNNATVSNHGLSKKMNDYYVGIINELIFENTLLPSMIYLIVLLCIGLPGNVLVCYIYHTKNGSHMTGTGIPRKKMKSSDIFILALAWLDILNCILSVPVEIYILRYFAQFDYPWICKVSRYASMVLNASSSFVLLGIAIDRFIGIKYSHSKYRFTASTAIKFVTVSVLLAIIISLPGIALYGTQTLHLKLEPYIYGKTCLIEDHFVHTNYPLMLSMFLLTVHLLFDTFFIILYGIVGKKIIRNRNLSSIRTHKDRRKSRSNTSQDIEISHITFSNALHQRDVDKNGNIELKGFKYRSEDDETFDNQVKSSVQYEDNNSNKKPNINKQKDSAVHGKVYKAGKTTFMLFAVTIVFMLTFAPYCAIAILRSVSSDDFYINLSNIEKTLYQLFLRSYLLSSAANPLIYSFLSDKFRQQCRNILNKLCKQC